MASHNKKGIQGEEQAVKYLIAKGYEIIEQNWRFKRFEIDIITKHGNELVFVEVKTRSSEEFGEPEESVNHKKQRHLLEGANYYIEHYEIDLNCRFDVIAIILNNEQVKINHIESAFSPEV